MCTRHLQPPSSTETYDATLAERIFQSLDGAFNFDSCQFDATNAFVNLDIAEELYVPYPEGFSPPWFQPSNSQGLVRLRQVQRLWCQIFSQTLKAIGREQVGDENYIFKAKCGTLLPSGHGCKQKCKDCRTRVKCSPDFKISHSKCQTICSRPYTKYRHTCRRLCHDEVKCPPCDAKCEVRYSRSECPKECLEPCQPCAEKYCISVCPYSACYVESLHSSLLAMMILISNRSSTL